LANIYAIMLILTASLYYRDTENQTLGSQSAYRKGHSTETAVLQILDEVFTAADDQQVSVMMVSLDLSAAFDTVDHSITGMPFA